jgi:hypothetical protein
MKKHFQKSVVVLVVSLFTTPFAFAYTCAPGETSIIDVIPWPSNCGGAALAILQCVNGNKTLTIVDHCPKSPEQTGG